ncbi:MAG: hypothetical protein OCC49_14480 [Fibrobacterales bacterium]
MKIITVIAPIVLLGIISCSDDVTINPSISSNQEQRFSSTALPESKFYSCLTNDSLGKLSSCIYYTSFPQFLFHSVEEACSGTFAVSECPADAVITCKKVSEEWLDKQVFFYSSTFSNEDCPADH